MADFLGRTWCEVLLDNLAYNYHAFERLAGPSSVMSIIKADAYGHADIPVAQALYKQGCRHFGVAALGEAIALRQAGIEGEILVLGHTRPELADKMAELSITQTLVSAGYARALSQALKNSNRRLKCHIKADTGMSRIGLICYDSHFEDAVKQAMAILEDPKLEVTGIFTHFCVADEPENPVSVDFTKLQHSRYMRFCKALEDKGYCLGAKHCSNSGAILHYPDYNHDMIRPGIALYGLYEEACEEKLLPCLRWLTTVSLVKEAAPGQTLSYGRTYTCQKPMKVASLSVGYADGLARALSNKGRVLINGQYAPIVGRICMDQCMVDVTGIDDVKPGDTAVLIGKQGDKEITMQEMAKDAQTITNEIATRISRRVPRVMMQNGKVIEVVHYQKDIE